MSTRLTVHWVTRLFRKPVRKKIRKKQKTFYKSGTTETVKIKGYTIKVFIKGKGKTVYINHGWSSYGYDMKTIANILLEEGYRVVIPDLPCHGRSSGRLTDQLTMSETVETLLLHYHTQTPISYIVTHSWGGAVALLALDRIRKNSHVEFQLEKMISISMPSRPNAIMDIFCDTLDLSEPIRKGLLENIVKIAQSDNRTLESAFPIGLTDLLTPASFDYLLIHGKNDDVVHHNDSILLAEKYPHIKTRIEEDADHINILKSESVHEVIVRHFKNSVH